MGLSKKGDSQATTLQNNAVAAQNTAAQVNPLQAQRQAAIQGFWGDMASGKDVKDIGYLSPYYNLYNDSQANAQNQNYGEGLLGKDNVLAGGSGQIAGVVGKQLAARNQQQAAGDLYNATQNAYGSSVAEGQGIADADTQQRLAIANLAENRYSSYLNRPRTPSFWERMLTGGVTGASAAAAG